MSSQRQSELKKFEEQEIRRNNRSADPPLRYTGRGGYAPGPAPLDKPPTPAFTLEVDKTAPSKAERQEAYPPIVTIDGRVDTDIDHLIEDIADDYSGPVDDIPSKYPKPHVFSVIEGSLDDDVDSYANDDGTMEHTLVDAPKNFNPRDLKDVAAKDLAKKVPNQAKGGQTSISHTNRSYNKMYSVDHEGPGEALVGEINQVLSEDSDGEDVHELKIRTEQDSGYQRSDTSKMSHSLSLEESALGDTHNPKQSRKIHDKKRGRIAGKVSHRAQHEPLLVAKPDSGSSMKENSGSHMPLEDADDYHGATSDAVVPVSSNNDMQVKCGVDDICECSVEMADSPYTLMEVSLNNNECPGTESDTQVNYTRPQRKPDHPLDVGRVIIHSSDHEIAALVSPEVDKLGSLINKGVKNMDRYSLVSPHSSESGSSSSKGSETVLGRNEDSNSQTGSVADGSICANHPSTGHSTEFNVISTAENLQKVPASILSSDSSDQTRGTRESPQKRDAGKLETNQQSNDCASQHLPGKGKDTKAAQELPKSSSIKAGGHGGKAQQRRDEAPPQSRDHLQSERYPSSMPSRHSSDPEERSNRPDRLQNGKNGETHSSTNKEISNGLSMDSNMELSIRPSESLNDYRSDFLRQEFAVRKEQESLTTTDSQAMELTAKRSGNETFGKDTLSSLPESEARLRKENMHTDDSDSELLDSESQNLLIKLKEINDKKRKSKNLLRHMRDSLDDSEQSREEAQAYVLHGNKKDDALEYSEAIQTSAKLFHLEHNLSMRGKEKILDFKKLANLIKARDKLSQHSSEMSKNSSRTRGKDYPVKAPSAPKSSGRDHPLGTDVPGNYERTTTAAKDNRIDQLDKEIRNKRNKHDKGKQVAGERDDQSLKYQTEKYGGKKLGQAMSSKLCEHVEEDIGDSGSIHGHSEGNHDVCFSEQIGMAGTKIGVPNYGRHPCYFTTSAIPVLRADKTSVSRLEELVREKKLKCTCRQHDRNKCRVCFAVNRCMHPNLSMKAKAQSNKSPTKDYTQQHMSESDRKKIGFSMYDSTSLASLETTESVECYSEFDPIENRMNIPLDLRKHAHFNHEKETVSRSRRQQISPELMDNSHTYVCTESFPSQCKSSGETKLMELKTSKKQSMKESLKAAMKVAEESMSAAARVAEALAFVMKAGKRHRPASASSTSEGEIKTKRDDYHKSHHHKSVSPSRKHKRHDMASPARSKHKQQKESPSCSPKVKSRKTGGSDRNTRKKPDPQQSRAESKRRKSPTVKAKPPEEICDNTSPSPSPETKDATSTMRGPLKPSSPSLCRAKPTNLAPDDKSAESFQNVENTSHRKDTASDGRTISSSHTFTKGPQVTIHIAYPKSPENAQKMRKCKAEGKSTEGIKNNSKDTPLPESKPAFHIRQISDTSCRISSEYTHAADAIDIEMKESDISSIPEEMNQASRKPAVIRHPEVDEESGAPETVPFSAEEDILQSPDHEEESTTVNQTETLEQKLPKDEWTIPQSHTMSGRKSESYFTQVTPKLDPKLQDLGAKNYFRRQIFGTCVDPVDLQSESESSIEYNANFNRSPREAVNDLMYFHAENMLAKYSHHKRGDKYIAHRPDCCMWQEIDPNLVYENYIQWEMGFKSVSPPETLICDNPDTTKYSQYNYQSRTEVPSIDFLDRLKDRSSDIQEQTTSSKNSPKSRTTRSRSVSQGRMTDSLNQHSDFVTSSSPDTTGFIKCSKGRSHHQTVSSSRGSRAHNADPATGCQGDVILSAGGSQYSTKGPMIVSQAYERGFQSQTMEASRDRSVSLTGVSQGRSAVSSGDSQPHTRNSDWSSQDRSGSLISDYKKYRNCYQGQNAMKCPQVPTKSSQARSAGSLDDFQDYGKALNDGCLCRATNPGNTFQWERKELKNASQNRANEPTNHTPGGTTEPMIRSQGRTGGFANDIYDKMTPSMKDRNSRTTVSMDSPPGRIAASVSEITDCSPGSRPSLQGRMTVSRCDSQGHDSDSDFCSESHTTCSPGHSPYMATDSALEPNRTDSDLTYDHPSSQQTANMFDNSSCRGSHKTKQESSRCNRFPSAGQHGDGITRLREAWGAKSQTQSLPSNRRDNFRDSNRESLAKNTTDLGRDLKQEFKHSDSDKAPSKRGNNQGEGEYYYASGQQEQQQSDQSHVSRRRHTSDQGLREDKNSSSRKPVPCPRSSVTPQGSKTCRRPCHPQDFEPFQLPGRDPAIRKFSPIYEENWSEVASCVSSNVNCEDDWSERSDVGHDDNNHNINNGNNNNNNNNTDAKESNNKGYDNTPKNRSSSFNAENIDATVAEMETFADDANVAGNKMMAESGSVAEQGNNNEIEESQGKTVDAAEKNEGDEEEGEDFEQFENRRGSKPGEMPSRKGTRFSQTLVSARPILGSQRSEMFGQKPSKDFGKRSVNFDGESLGVHNEEDSSSDQAKGAAAVPEIHFDPPPFLLKSKKIPGGERQNTESELFGEVIRLQPIPADDPASGRQGKPKPPAAIFFDWNRYITDKKLCRNLAMINNRLPGQDTRLIKTEVSRHTENRISEQEQISRENEKIFMRILKMESNYSRDQLLKDYQKKLPQLVRYSRWPEALMERYQADLGFRNVQVAKADDLGSKDLQVAKANYLVRKQAEAIDAICGCSRDVCTTRYPRPFVPASMTPQKRKTSRFDDVQTFYPRHKFEQDFQVHYRKMIQQSNWAHEWTKWMSVKPTGFQRRGSAVDPLEAANRKIIENNKKVKLATQNIIEMCRNKEPPYAPKSTNR